MASSVLNATRHDDIQRDDAQRDDSRRDDSVWQRATGRWPSFTAAEALWSTVGLMLLTAFLILALANG